MFYNLVLDSTYGEGDAHGTVTANDPRYGGGI